MVILCLGKKTDSLPQVPQMTKAEQLHWLQWKIKQMLSKQILPSKINNIVNNLKDIGVNALKLLGAGGGGYFIFYVRPFEKFHLLDYLKSKHLTVQKFRFEQDI